MFGRRAIERCLTAKFSGYLDSYLTTHAGSFGQSLRADPELATVLRQNPRMLAQDTRKVLVSTSFKKFVFPQKADEASKSTLHQPSHLRFYREVVPDTVVHDRSVEPTTNMVAIEAKMKGATRQDIGQDILKLVGFLEQLHYRFGVFLELPRNSEHPVEVTTITVVGEVLEARFWTVPESDIPPHLEKMSDLLVALQKRQHQLEQSTVSQPIAHLLQEESLLFPYTRPDGAFRHQIALTGELVIALAQAPGKHKLDMNTVLAQLSQSPDRRDWAMAWTMQAAWDSWSGVERSKYLKVVAKIAKMVLTDIRPCRAAR